MDVTISAALIGAGATCFAAIAGFGALFIQMARQGALNRTAMLDAEARKLRTSMYEDGVAAARSLSDAAIGFSSRLHTINVELRIASMGTEGGYSPPVPGSRYSQLLELNKSFTDSALRFIFLIENRRILDPRLIIFRDVLSASLFDLRETVSRRFSRDIMFLLPVDDPSGGIFPYDPPTPAALEAAEEAINEATSPLYNVVGWVEDFLVEIQNLMLGDLFPNGVSHRQPNDPQQRVIRLDSYDELQAWLAATPWGKHLERENKRAANAAREPT